MSKFVYNGLSNKSAKYSDSNFDYLDFKISLFTFQQIFMFISAVIPIQQC